MQKPSKIFHLSLWPLRTTTEGALLHAQQSMDFASFHQASSWQKTRLINEFYYRIGSH